MRALRAVSIVVAGCATHATPSPAPMTCGSGTVLQDTECIAMPTVCAPGTHEVVGACNPDRLPGYQVRASSQIVADGVTPAAVIAFGTNPDGTPATDEIIFSTDRFGAGDYTQPRLTLDERGGVAVFVPCNAASSAGCLGPLHVTIARASAPSTVIAQFPVELIAPPTAGSVEHCLGSTNLLYLEGTGFIYTGQLTVTSGAFLDMAASKHVEVQVIPTDPIQGTQWSLTFDTVQLGTVLAPGVYPNTTQGAVVNQPTMTVTGQTPFASCASSFDGEFQVHDYAATPALHTTISFREWCDGYPDQVLSGCIHVE